MRKTRLIAGGAALALLAATALHGQEVFSPGFMKVEYYFDIPGTTIDELLASPKFPDSPDLVEFTTSYESRTNWRDEYGVRISGYFVPEVTGTYVFFISSDDQGRLYLSTDDDPENKHLIAEEPIWNDARQWTVTSNRNAEAPDNRSDRYIWTEWPNFNWDIFQAEIELEAGQRYYTEALMKEGEGGDNLGVTVKLAGEPDPANGSPALSGTRIGTFADPTGVSVTLTQSPQDTTGVEGKSVTFTAAVASTPPESPVSYQWQRNGSDITGATELSYTTPLLSLDDDGDTYRVLVRALGGITETSDDAVLTVVPDTFPPEIVAAGAMNRHGGGIEVGIVFDKPIASGATTVGNYSLSAGSISAARFISNSSGIDSPETAVVLSTTGLQEGETYTVTVTGLTDELGNTMTPVDRQFTVSHMTWVSIGRVEQFQPDAIAVGNDGFNLISGGASFWENNDDVTFVYEEVSGDFDKVARVEWHDPSSHWARAGLHVREILNANEPTAGNASRHQTVHLSPMFKYDGTAANRAYETNRRMDHDGPTDQAGSSGEPTYPNSWVRLKRDGQMFTMLRSSDGSEWIELGTTDFSTSADGPLPDQLFVGPVYGPELGNISDAALHREFAALFREYGDFREFTDITLMITRDGDNVTIEWSPPAGQLQSAPAVTGPWNEAGTSSPVTVEIGPAASQFFRVAQ